MVDGTYEVSVKVAFKKHKARVTFKSAGSKLKVTIEALGKTKVMKGTCTDDAFMFEGKVKVPILGEIQCDLTGFLTDDGFIALAKTNKGDYEIYGKRV